MVIKDDKFLITRRSANKKRFPGIWTVSGGKMETSDYLQLPKDTEHYWYNVLERTLRREVKEEVGIDIENIEYLTSLATVHADGSPEDVNERTAGVAGIDGGVRLNKAAEFLRGRGRVGLRGNFLIRARRHFIEDGFLTVVIDAPSDEQGKFFHAFRELLSLLIFTANIAFFGVLNNRLIAGISVIYEHF